MTVIYKAVIILIMGMLIVDPVPDDIKKRFKMYCLEHDITMKEFIIWLMDQIPKGNILSCPINGKKK